MAKKKRGYLYTPTAPVWIRGAATIRDGWISLDPALTERYSPITTPNPSKRQQKGERPLPLLFALIAARTHAQILQFVNDYGLLTHGPKAAKLREPVAEFDRQASLLRAIVRLNRATGEAVKGDADQLEIVRATIPMLGIESLTGSDEEVLAQASVAIAMLVSDQLRATTWGIEASCFYDQPDNAPGFFQFTAVWPTLLSGAYFQLAMLMVDRQPLRVCEGCETLFVQHDPRQSFCGPACSARYRNRKKYRLDKQARAKR